MKLIKLQIMTLAAALSLAPVVAEAVKLEDAARQAARQNDAKVLSARTIKQGNRRVHEIKLLTKKGVVKTVRVPDNSQPRKR